jgi:hypothetical protein
MILPLVFTLILAGLSLLPSIRENPKLIYAFTGSAAALLLWIAWLNIRSRRSGRTLVLKWHPRKQHYIQACAQGSVLLYWGWYWHPVYDHLIFIAAQLLFAYAFDMLLIWSRRDEYTLGFAPFPVVFSINLFLWFRADWFFLQFAMVALGIAAKEMIRWKKDGRLTHIFNPSSFPLAIASVVLLAMGASGITWGQDIAVTQFYPPHMYLMLFLIGLPGQLFFGVTLMTMSAVVSTYLFGLIYFHWTGVYFFYDSYIPIAVFLGMHLLFNDPSTSPRTEFGRIIFGALYGLSTCALYYFLGSMGMPTFYDKLLQVPFLNLSVRAIDRAVRSKWLRSLDPAAIARTLIPYQRHLAFMSIWALVFAVLSAVQGVGDDHPGQWLPFWRQACEDGRPYACPYLADMQLNFCAQGSAWSCNEAGLLHIALSRTGEDLRRAQIGGAAEPFQKGCELGLQAGCNNLRALRGSGEALAHTEPEIADYPIVLRGSKGSVRSREPVELAALACREGWVDACEGPR